MANDVENNPPVPALTFKVAPHAIEDLGSNLYTSFPKVLAEFVANAYDADASRVDIRVNFQQIDGMRKIIRQAHTEAKLTDPDNVRPLAEERLPLAAVVEIRDDGFGMTAEDVNQRFLFTGRKRRKHAPVERTKNWRPLMGRKGLGKLAGFGIASCLEVITKKASSPEAIRFRLDYDYIMKNDELESLPLEGVSWDRGTFSESASGTVIRLSGLNFEAVKSQRDTVERELSEHFEFIEPTDFAIFLNEDPIPRPETDFAFAWPQPDVEPTNLVQGTIETDYGPQTFYWRFRFRPDRKSLEAAKRGVRVYASNRLAAAPSLFDADTNMHGFRMTDYLDGIVKADFLDLQNQDYIATDRQSLRWDTPLLAPLKAEISAEIKTACKKYQEVRDRLKSNEVMADPFTLKTIEDGKLPSRQKSIVKSVAVRLARLAKQGVNDAQYKEVLPQIVRAIGNGELFSKLVDLASSSSPDVEKLLLEIVKLNRSEVDGSTHIVRARLQAIDALKKLVAYRPEDGGPRNEVLLQELFEEAPWLMDPLYQSYITADKSLNTTFKALSKALGFDRETGSDSAATRTEADFVFFLMHDPGNANIVIVELKASNKDAEVDDIMQLREYMTETRTWLTDHGHGGINVRGELICTPPPRGSSNKKFRRFWIEVDELNKSMRRDHAVRSYTIVLEHTRTAHQDMLNFALRLDAESASESSGE